MLITRESRERAGEELRQIEEILGEASGNRMAGRTVRAPRARALTAIVKLFRYIETTELGAGGGGAPGGSTSIDKPAERSVR